VKAWAVSDWDYEIQIPVIAATRGRAKVIALREFLHFDDYIDLKCSRVQSPIPLPDEEKVLGVEEALWYGFRWNDETMADEFGDEWFRSWLSEAKP
jgi:hypothetical protein